jgi:hypothetical protein
MSASARRLVALLFGAVVALPAVARAAEPSKQELARIGKAASAFVLVKGASGSAFCVHPSGLFVTNQHVVEDNREVILVLNANQKEQRVVKARVVRADPEADLALIQAESVKDFPALRVGGDDKLSEGAEVVACGFPFGQALALAREEYPAVSITFGRITALRQKSGELESVQLDVELHPGNSGGPVLGSDGRVAAVVVAGIRGTRLRFAIPARKVLRLLEQPTVTFRPPTPPRGDWRKPVPFEVRVASVLPADKPFEVELILTAPDGKERTFRLIQGEDAYRGEAPLVEKAEAAPLVRCTAVVRRDGKELARLGHWVFDEARASRVYLADLTEADFRKGPWDLGKGGLGDPGRSPIRVGGRNSPKGLGTHPDCSVTYRLKKAGLVFRSEVAIDDSGRADRAGPITFEVLGDGKVLWRSRAIFVRGETDECAVDVRDVDALELRVSVAGTNFRAHAVWLEPHLLTAPGHFRPDPVVTLGERERTIKKLRAAVEDAALGGGGRYLVLSLPGLRKVAVLDVTDPGTMKLIDMDETGGVRIAAGADKLLVLYTDKKILDRYGLTTLKKETSIDLPFEFKVTSVAMGSAGHGPLLLVGEQPPLTGVAQFMDVERMRKFEPARKGQNAAHTGEGTTVLASADGRGFGVGGGNFFSRGFHTIVLDGDTATTFPCGERAVCAWPGADGQVVYTSNGRYSDRLLDPAKGPRHRGSLCLPAAQGDLYLKAHTDAFSLYLEGDEEPLLRMAGAGWPDGPAAAGPLPSFKRIFLLPAADLIVTIPAGKEEVHFHPFAFSVVSYQACRPFWPHYGSLMRLTAG